jgi:hypothetical protein
MRGLRRFGRTSFRARDATAARHARGRTSRR